MTFTIKRNDTRTALKAKLINRSGNPVELAGATVRFVMNNGISRDALIIDEPNGEVLFVFRPGDTSHSGIYKAEFRVTYPDGNRETFPNNGHIPVYIYPNLGE
ncbi:BppU family phage baseplate upper protein [Desulforamulus reducens]|uniref:BppU family phage baseplate upper protein n=1 Tax=Desulforamulus reducens TaxID=59610 RepID=UPI00059B6F8F|nr:BppU family phage baseplate upper protein [Desulforamulus reducens]